MASREESLRNILASVAGSDRLSEEQRREIVAHLDDSVDAKVGAGTPEIEAVAQAFVELGDVRTIARRFPAPSLLSTPEGMKLVADSRYRAGTATGLLLFFMFLQWTVTPRFAAVFRTVNVKPPLLSDLFIGISNGLVDGFPIKFLIAGAGLGVVIYALPLVRAPRAVSYGLLALAWALFLGLLVALSMPLVGLMEGIRRV